MINEQKDDSGSLPPVLHKPPCCTLPFSLYNEDCLQTIKRIKPGSVDLMLTDMPYGTTQNNWDNKIDLAVMWHHWLNIISDKGCWVFTSAEPFTSELIMSCKAFFKYDLIWNKKRPTGHLNKDIMPLRQHEQILVFAKGRHTYNPQKHKNKLARDFRGNNMKPQTDNYGSQKNYVSELDPEWSYPRSIWEHTAVIGNSNDKLAHPTQKPLPLFRELVRTYSNEGDLVFDGYSGSGTTAAACLKEKRRFIGSELNKEYYDLSMKRLTEISMQPELF